MFLRGILTILYIKKILLVRKKPLKVIQSSLQPSNSIYNQHQHLSEYDIERFNSKFWYFTSQLSVRESGTARFQYNIRYNCRFKTNTLFQKLRSKTKDLDIIQTRPYHPRPFHPQYHWLEYLPLVSTNQKRRFATDQLSQHRSQLAKLSRKLKPVENIFLNIHLNQGSMDMVWTSTTKFVNRFYRTIIRNHRLDQKP